MSPSSGLLLDTHAFLWAASNPSELSVAARAAIEDSSREVFVSAAVAWEIAIKYGLGKLELPHAPATYVPARIASLGFKPLAISVEHAVAVASLPAYHNDPFDRILVAQAQVEGLILITNDAAVRRYPVETLPAGR
jgi:PIN domain nuclease of toxin-antitoxin system